MYIDIDIKKALEVILSEKHAAELAAGQTRLSFLDWIKDKGINLNVRAQKSIKQIVCDSLNVEVNRVFAPDMPREHSETRHICAYFYIKLFNTKTGDLARLMSTEQVGILLHTTRQNIEKSVDKIKGLYEVEPAFRNKLNSIEQTIYSYFNADLLKVG